MFSQNTVFILGAGSSWHYNYPTGEELVNEIKILANSFSKSWDKSFRRILDEQILYSTHFISMLPIFIQEMAGHDPAKIDDAFKATLKNLDSLYEKIIISDPMVIDHFLCFNTDIAKIAKILIAAALLRHERKSAEPRGNWYKFLIQKLMSGCNRSDDLHQNKVKFITFNYDLSLEYKLYKGLGVNHIFSDKENLSNFFTDDRFLHVYGKLRSSKIEEPFYKISDNDFNKKELDIAYEASKDIKTIDPSDKIEDLTTMKLASKAIHEANVVYILGYGFDRDNSQRLGLDRLLRIPDNQFYDGTKKVFFTNYLDKNLVNKRASELFFGNLNHFVPPSPAIEGTTQTGAYFEKSSRNIYDALNNDFELI